jgi:hypothetical protein
MKSVKMDLMNGRSTRNSCTYITSCNLTPFLSYCRAVELCSRPVKLTVLLQSTCYFAPAIKSIKFSLFLMVALLPRCQYWNYIWSMMISEYRAVSWRKIGRETEALQENLSQCIFVHHMAWPGIEHEQRWETAWATARSYMQEEYI